MQGLMGGDGAPASWLSSPSTASAAAIGCSLLSPSSILSSSSARLCRESTLFLHTGLAIYHATTVLDERGHMLCHLLATTSIHHCL